MNTVVAVAARRADLLPFTTRNHSRIPLPIQMLGGTNMACPGFWAGPFYSLRQTSFL